MDNREDRIATLVDRALEERTMRLCEVIERENLTEYELGYEDILYADSTNNVIVPCEGFMILAREYYDDLEKCVSAEYAVYSQHDRDGHNIANSLNMNAVYKLEFVGEETFRNMASAIAYAADLIYRMHGTDSDDPVDIVMNTTDPGMNLSIEDAGRIIGEAEASGWKIPSTLTPERFIEIYNDLEPEEEE